MRPSNSKACCSLEVLQVEQRLNAYVLWFGVSMLQPDYYANKPSTHWNGTKMVASFNDYLSCCFHTEWYSMAEALSCRNGPDSCVQYQFTGPVWGHLNLRTTTIDWFLK
jgi:hypothetical protein